MTLEELQKFLEQLRTADSSTCGRTTLRRALEKAQRLVPVSRTNWPPTMQVQDLGYDEIRLSWFDGVARQSGSGKISYLLSQCDQEAQDWIVLYDLF